MASIDRFLRPLTARLPSWVTPNRITVLRGTLVLPILALQAEHPLVAGWGIYLPAMLLDALDGPLARHRGITSETGAMLDATVDKLFLHGIVWLALLPLVGVRVAVLLLGLDIALTAVRPLKRRFGRTARANGFGKLKTVVMAFGAGFVLTRTPDLVSVGLPLLDIAAALAGASLALHIIDLFRTDAS